jgi:hypothetical protein
MAPPAMRPPSSYGTCDSRARPSWTIARGPPRFACGGARRGPLDPVEAWPPGRRPRPSPPVGAPWPRVHPGEKMRFRGLAGRASPRGARPSFRHRATSASATARPTVGAVVEHPARPAPLALVKGHPRRGPPRSPGDRRPSSRCRPPPPSKGQPPATTPPRPRFRRSGRRDRVSAPPKGPRPQQLRYDFAGPGRSRLPTARWRPLRGVAGPPTGTTQTMWGPWAGRTDLEGRADAGARPR